MLRVGSNILFTLFIQSVFLGTGRTEEPECGKVHLTVSPLDAFLELNWIEECSNTEIVLDEIILSTKNLAESDDSEEVLLRIDPSMTSSGYYKTKIKFGHPFLPGGWDYEDELTSQAPGPHCFPYWIASTSNKAILHSRCLAIQPTWMADNSGSLGSRHIETIMIPGTHNAGAYVGSSTFYKKFILNQDREIWTQLVFGIRYLDFRIAYYKRDGFYLNHDKFKVQKVRPLFQQIKKFLQRSPKEIVILDFHRFPYPSQFTQRLHTMFIDIVNEDLGEFAVPVFGGRKGPTLEEIWATNKSLIISYHNQEAVEASIDSSVDDKPWLWHPLPQQWANTKSLSALKKYMEKSIREIGQVRRTNPLWALMAELTPQPIDFVLGTYDVRKSAQDTNREINNWFRYEFGKDSNIVATDYFLGNDIIDAAIDINTGYNRSKLTS